MRHAPLLQLLEYAQAFAIDFVVHRPFAHRGFPGGQSPGSAIREHPEIIGHQVGSIFRPADDEQHTGGVPQQAGRQEAHDAPTTPSNVAERPAWSSATAAEKPLCVSKRRAKSVSGRGAVSTWHDSMGTSDSSSFP